MRAGYGEQDITPAIGAPLNGFAARLSPSTGVDLPLKARALWLESGGERAILITLDLLGISDATAESWTARIGAELGLPAQAVILHCSHTHAGPMSVPLRGVGPADEEYLKTVGQAVIRAAAQAVAAAEPVQLRWGHEPVRIGMNRRQHVPGRGVVLGRNPGGPCDDRVRVLQLIGDHLSLCLFNHACHPYCVGPDHTVISPDFCGHAVAALERSGHQGMYLNGCAADIAPLRAFEGAVAADEEGHRLAQAALAAVHGAEPVARDPHLSVRSRRLSLAYQRVPPIESLARLIDDSDRTVRDEDRSNPTVRRRIHQAWKEWLNALAAAPKPLRPLETRVTTLRLGPVSIAALPGEIFYETGRDLAPRFDGQHAIVAGYCHGFIGYVPPAHAHPEGGYEVEEAHRFIDLWKFNPDATDTLCEAAERLAKAEAVEPSATP